MGFFLSLALAMSSGSANADCDAAFFDQFSERAANHLCDVTLAPTCMVSSVKWSSAGSLTIGSVVATSIVTSKALAVGLNAYYELKMAGTREFAEALRSGKYFESKLMGHPVFERSPPKAKLSPSFGILSKLALWASLYFTYDDHPKRCNATLEGSYKTQKIIGGVCHDDLALSENVVRFLARSREEQVSAAKNFPSVCAFYQELDKKLRQISGPEIKMTKLECSSRGQPESVMLSLDGENNRVRLLTQSQGQVMAVESQPTNPSQDGYLVRFNNPQEVASVAVLNRGETIENLDMENVREQASSGYMKGVPRLLRALRMASPVAETCCTNPQREGCSVFLVAKNNLKAPAELQPEVHH